MFGRRKSEYEDGGESERDVAAVGKPAEPAEPARGPFDAAEVPEDGVVRLDLGALRVPMRDGMELRVEMNEQTPIAATLVMPAGTLQMLVFAAPRSLGIWDDVRAELSENMVNAGGTTRDAEGPFGTELRVTVKAESEPGKQVDQALRFIGIDGPRWLLRATVSGAAATDDAQAQDLLDLLAQVVVDRGEEAMAPRDLLPLRLPVEAQAAAEQAQPSIDPFKRGPEITERR